MTPVAVQLREV